MEKDYIERDALIDILNAKADMALGTPKQVFLSVAKMVELLPTAYVVEVVRCKDCKHYGANVPIVGGKECIHFSGYDEVFTEPDDFCSYGERREE